MKKNSFALGLATIVTCFAFSLFLAPVVQAMAAETAKEAEEVVPPAEEETSPAEEAISFAKNALSSAKEAISSTVISKKYNLKTPGGVVSMLCNEGYDGFVFHYNDIIPEKMLKKLWEKFTPYFDEDTKVLKKVPYMGQAAGVGCFNEGYGYFVIYLVKIKNHWVPSSAVEDAEDESFEGRLDVKTICNKCANVEENYLKMVNEAEMEKIISKVCSGGFKECQRICYKKLRQESWDNELSMLFTESAEVKKVMLVGNCAGVGCVNEEFGCFVLFFKKVDDEWKLCDLEDEHDETFSRQLTEDNILYKCNR